MRCAWRTTTAPRLLLPAPKDRVGQDDRPEQQRGRRQKDGRTTTRRSRNGAACGGAISYYRSKHGGVPPGPGSALWAIASGTRINIARRAAVARNIALFTS